jgi:hypothetical protein
MPGQECCYCRKDRKECSSERHSQDLLLGRFLSLLVDGFMKLVSLNLEFLGHDPSPTE